MTHANARNAVVALALAACALLGHAETGVTSTEILIGMSNAQTGPASGLGRKLKEGATAYLNRVNDAGGIHGRKLKLVSYDDGYEPERAAAMTAKLINEDKVFTLFGYVGTPTSSAALPLASKAQVPLRWHRLRADMLGGYLFRMRGRRAEFEIA